MNKFVSNLLKQSEDNPVLAIGAGAAAITAIAKLLDSASSVRSKNAYAKQIKNKRKKSR